MPKYLLLIASGAIIILTGCTDTRSQFERCDDTCYQTAHTNNSREYHTDSGVYLQCMQLCLPTK